MRVITVAAFVGAFACASIDAEGQDAMAAEKISAPVKVAEADGAIVLSNGLLEVWFDKASGGLTARAAQAKGKAFITGARLSDTGGEASVVSVRDGLGAGRAIEVKYKSGGADRVALYPGVPFVCFKPRLHNAGKQAKTVNRITPASVTIDLGKDLEDLRVLGCDGLTDAAKKRTSYSFLAVADPKTRAGVAAGWLTHNRGSGIVLSAPDGKAIRIDGRSEYGNLRIDPGKTADGETFAVGYFADTLDGLEAYADAAAKATRIKLSPVTSGYCTWYHARALDEKRMAELADFCGKHLTKFGFAVLQIDDGWQISGRDFTTHNGRGKYSSGMKPMADKIRAAGMRAGIWFIPFGWDHKREVFKDHQDWFVHRTEDNQVYTVKWAGTCLDMTHPGARKFLRQVVSRICRQWGYKYIKIDGLWTGMAVRILYPRPTYRDDKLGDAVFHDPSKTNVEAYRDGLALVREAAGDDVFILGCNIAQNFRTLGASFGRVDGMRIGHDIGANWDRIKSCALMGTRLYFLHNRVWYNDPDCLMLRKPLTLAQARAWGAWTAVSGQLNVVSEWLPGLPAEKLDVVRRSMPNHGLCGRPVDLFESNMARIWQLTSGSGAQRRDIIALFNWGGEEAAITVPLAKLGLPGAAKDAYVGFDYWGGKFIGPFSGVLEVKVPPNSCRVLAVRSAADRPQVISTSRHISQGVADLSNEKWAAATKTLSGTSKVVAGDPYEIRIVAPKGMKAIAAKVSAAAKATIKITDAGPNVRAVISSAENRSVRWSVKFE